jgi:hypothetical protein
MAANLSASPTTDQKWFRQLLEDHGFKPIERGQFTNGRATIRVEGSKLRAVPGDGTKDWVGDIGNPFAVGIARFRLLISALKAVGINRLKSAPNFRLNLAVGDSLLHGRRFRDFESNTGPQRTFDSGDAIFRDELKHHYEVEDVEALHRILGQQYHAVVGNPPYITVKDKAVSELYRARFPSCHRKYSLSVPFMERFFDLAVKGDGTPHQPAGFVGKITANSFMKAEFGKKLIEEYLPRWDLTHVLDTSGAYIPGHGTPTVVLFGKNQLPISSTVRAVMGIKAEPGLPADPAQGLVWKAITAQCDLPGSVSDFVSVAQTTRHSFHVHPWNVGGGGISELKVRIAELTITCPARLEANDGTFSKTTAAGIRSRISDSTGMNRSPVSPSSGFPANPFFARPRLEWLVHGMPPIRMSNGGRSEVSTARMSA